MEITADRFDGNQEQGVSVFTGHVTIIKGKDELNATKVYVFTDDKNRPTQYKAEGNVSFLVSSDDNSTYRGRSQLLIYYPELKEYHFYTQVYIQEIHTLRTLSGEEVVINSTSGNARVVGKKEAPIRITFPLEDDNKTKKGINANPPAVTNSSES